MKNLKILTGLLAVAVMAAVAIAYFIMNEDAPGGAVNTLGTDGVAIRGYDPVAYFTEGAPKEGKPGFSVEYKDATWQFASAANKALFEADPEKYVPAYGGYCAYGVAQGYLVKIEPDAWAIRDGRLYLNYDQSIQKSWSEKPAEYIAEADMKWPELISD